MTENVRTSFMEGPMPVCQSEIKLKFKHFNAQGPKMVRHTLKILQYMLQDF